MLYSVRASAPGSWRVEVISGPTGLSNPLILSSLNGRAPCVVRGALHSTIDDGVMSRASPSLGYALDIPPRRVILAHAHPVHGAEILEAGFLASPGEEAALKV